VPRGRPPTSVDPNASCAARAPSASRSSPLSNRALDAADGSWRCIRAIFIGRAPDGDPCAPRRSDHVVRKLAVRTLSTVPEKARSEPAVTELEELLTRLTAAVGYLQ
jgi:hypothetical protein